MRQASSKIRIELFDPTLLQFIDVNEPAFRLSLDSRFDLNVVFNGGVHEFMAKQFIDLEYTR